MRYGLGFLVWGLFLHLRLGGQTPVELGTVSWLRNYNTAIERGKKEQKPVLILFQEVPGCQTCQRYGQDVLTHPLIVDAIEHYFVPVAIFNNRGGADATILKKYGEPAWNNPVVRVINAITEQDVAPRVGNNYTPGGLVRAMIQALTKSQGQALEFLHVLEEEFTGRHQGLTEATFAMYCFWTGEKLLGGLDGVIQTRAGFSGGREVVKVWYDASKLPASQLEKFSQQNQCEKTNSGNFRHDHTPKYFISNSPYRYIPMSETQASRINSLLGQHKDARTLLSPTQLNWLEEVQKTKPAALHVWVEKDLKEGWQELTKTWSPRS